MILVALASFVIYRQTVGNGKNYEIEPIKEYHYFVLKQNDLYGVMDRKGNTIIPPAYSEVMIPNPQRAVFICHQGEVSKILNEQNEEILTQFNKAQSIRLQNITSDLMYEKSVLKYEKDGKYGLVN